MTEPFMTRFADQANDVLKAILDQSVECILLTSASGEIEYVNPSGQHTLGVKHYTELASTDWAALWPEETHARARLAVDRAQRGQQDRFNGYFVNLAGETLWLDVCMSPIFDAGEHLTHLLATARDVTDQMQERLQDRMLREDAQRQAERSDSVAREMRHRLKNQLAVVASVAKLLARNSASAPELIERLEGKLQALARAQDLLTVHRERPPLATVAIAQVLEASGAGEKIVVRDIPDASLGDDAIQQLALVLGELQTNSLKYGALGGAGGRIELSGEVAAKTLSLRWHEDTGRLMVPPSSEGSGFKLLARLGANGGRTPTVEWHRSGPSITFHIRAL